VPGFLARYESDKKSWNGACPDDIESSLIYFRRVSKASNASIAGAFLWLLGPMLDTANKTGACPGPKPPDMSAYTKAIETAMAPLSPGQQQSR
jgi:hypothetical protein